MTPKRLKQQIDFILEMDRLKSIIRRTFLLHEDRNENSAEHSWHIALMACVLQEYANQPVDISRVMRMLLLHDIIEIDAGDTFVYDAAAQADKEQREQQAADRLFALLPSDQAGEFRGLWDEFEARETAEARFAKAIDRMMPILHNFYSQGKGWRHHGIRRRQVLDYNAKIADGAEELWEFTQKLIDEAVGKGYLMGDA